MIIISLLLGAIAAFWVYFDARRRGQDRNKVLAWSLGTLAAALVKLPLLVLLLALYVFIGRKGLLQENHDAAQIIDVEATVVEETRLACRACGRNVDETFALCPYCGQKLSPEPDRQDKVR